MDANGRNKFLGLMSFHLLWGSVLWFSISKLGLGISTDSVHLLFGAENLAEAGRLISFDGAPLLQWPPLYPALLAGLHLLTGIGAFAAANVLQVAAYAGASICLSLLFLQVFPDDFGLALAGNVLSDIGVVVVAGFDLLGSDYLHFFLVILLCLLAGYYIHNHSAKTYVAMAAAGMLAMLARYLGVAAIVTGALCVLFWGGGNIVKRLGRGFFLLLAAVPAGAWLVATSPLVGRRAPISFGENFQWFSRSVLEWLAPYAALKPHLTLYIVLLWAMVAALTFVTVRLARPRLSPFAKPVLLFGLAYLLALFGSAAVAYYNKLGGRFLLPLYVPFITLLLVALKEVPEAAKRRSARLARTTSVLGSAALVLAALLLLGTSVPAIRASHDGASGAGENTFNTAEWRSNEALRFWRAHPTVGRYRLFSNLPDGVAFHTGHACEPSPRQFSGPYGSTEFPVEGYAGSLFSAGQNTYMIWIEPNPYDYYYQPEDLKPIAEVEELFSGPGGAVYRLKPKTKP